MSCLQPAVYRVLVDWDGNGIPEDDVTDDSLRRQPLTMGWGRDTNRVLSPVSAGDLEFELCNVDGDYSPENPSSPFYEDLKPGRLVHVDATLKENGVVIADGSGRTVSTPDTGVLDITGDIDIRWDGMLTDWTPGVQQYLVAKYTAVGDQRSYALTVLNGRARLVWSTNGTSGGVLSVESTQELKPHPTTGRLAVRATLDVNVGGTSRRTTFYTADSISGPWSQLGSAILETGTTSIFSSTTPLTVSVADDAEQLVGTVYGIRVRNGIDGTLVANPDFTGQPVGSASFADSSGRTWTFNGGTSVQQTALGYDLASMTIEDFVPTVKRGDRSVKFTCADILQSMQQEQLSTTLFRGVRSGTAVNTVLDLAGWPADKRDIDPGASYFDWWWIEDDTGFEAIAKIIKSEGPPSIAYLSPDGTFVYRDRHHRLLDGRALYSQATYSAKAFACDAPDQPGMHFHEPFGYDNGIRDVINHVRFDVQHRVQRLIPENVFETEDIIDIPAGSQRRISFSTSDPFNGAATPVINTDYTVQRGAVTMSLTRTSGQSAAVIIQAVGATDATILGLRVRARFVAATGRTVEVTDDDSVETYRRRSYPDDAPYANAHDSLAIAELIVVRYAERKARLSVRIVNCTDEILKDILNRRISDRVTVIHGELGLDAEFHIERLEHNIRGALTGAGPSRNTLHALTMGLEKDRAVVSNPFILDESVLDTGQLGAAVTSSQKWMIFDDPVNGKFNTGVLGY